MEFISWLLALFCLSRDQEMHQSNRRAEAFRLATEVSSEAGRVLDIIAAATPRLERRCAQVCGTQPTLCDDMKKNLNDQRNEALQIMNLADNLKNQIMTATGRVDWETTLLQCHQWRATAARMVPWVEGIVNRYDLILHEAGAR